MGKKSQKEDMSTLIKDMVGSSFFIILYSGFLLLVLYLQYLKVLEGEGIGVGLFIVMMLFIFLLGVFGSIFVYNKLKLEFLKK